MKRGFYLLCSLTVALTMLAAGSAMCAKTIVIQVSDEFDLKDTESTVVLGQTCLPVRAVAEAMGAKVNWDDKSGVLTVASENGTAILRLGDTSATINGAKVSFPIAPFMHRGRFFAPFDFYHRFFNMGLRWDPFLHAYRWVWILPPAPYPTPQVIYGPGSTGAESAPQPGRGSRLVAEVVSVVPSEGTITVAVGNKTVHYAVARDAVILRGRVGSRAVEAPLAEIRPGDRVILMLDNTGVVTSIRAQYQEARGAIESISDDRIALDSRRRLKVTDQTRVVLPGNTGGRLQDLSIGDQVIASISPISGDTYLIAVQQPAMQTQLQANVFLNTYGPLNVGDILRVTFKGTPGAKVSFSIPGVAENLRANETAPGMYDGEYTVQPGDALFQQPIKVTVMIPGGDRFEVLSPKPVTITTESAYLPKIISPKTGEIIGSPIVVTGIADPGSSVQVSVEFRRNFLGMMPVEGLSDLTVVKAGADGVWKTEPLAATAPFHDIVTEFPFDFGVLQHQYDLGEYPTTYSITAIEIGSDGGGRSSYKVEVQKGHGVEVGI